jgi:hypothetical protein
MGAGGAGGSDGATTGTTSGGGEGGDGSTATSSTSTTGSGGASAGECEAYPTTGPVLAMSQLFVGDTNPDGSANAANGWKQYGFDIDGLVSDAQSAGLCKPSDGAAPSSIYPDGDAGIDNSFGKNVLPIFLSLAPSFGANANASLTGGEFTLLFYLEGLGAGDTQDPVTAHLYTGAPTPSAPLFDGSDCWPTSPDSLDDPSDIDSVKVHFPTSSLAQNHWTSGVTGIAVLEFRVQGYPLRLTIHQARFAMDLDAAHGSATAGQIGGVLDTAEFVGQVTNLAGAFDPSLCSGAVVDAIASQLRQASDILVDGSQDPAKTCNGISIGLGFKAVSVELGTIAPAVAPPPDPCP